MVSEIPEAAATLAEAFWPGPLTMIFKKTDCVPYETTGGLDTVAVRMPQHMGALQFLEEAGVPVAAPSANTSGRPSPTLAKHVKEDLDGKIDMIIDGGEVGIGFESTIVDVTEEIPVILRPGFITQKMLQEIVGEVQMDPALMQVSGRRRLVSLRRPNRRTVIRWDKLSWRAPEKKIPRENICTMLFADLTNCT